MAKDYIYENHALANDSLALYVLMAESDFGDEVYREISGISYDRGCIEAILEQVEPDPDAENRYYVHRVEQMTDELFQAEFKVDEPLKGECYLVFRGPYFEQAEEVLGYFKEEQHAFYYAEIARSFLEENAMIIRVPLDTKLDSDNVEEISTEEEWD